MIAAHQENSLLVRLRPDGPWRLGPPSGARDRVDSICHSDTLYAALCAAMLSLGSLEDWLDATARDTAPEGPAVRLSSMLPWQADLLYVAGPRHLWPPPAARLRTRGAQFIPTSLLPALLASQAGEGGPALEEDKWEVDGVSRCLIRAGRKGAFAGPFRHSLRSNAAVDRSDNGRTQVHQTACLEFSPNAGMWCVAQFRSSYDQQKWTAPLQAAFRLLADSGIGGERSRGWGHASVEEFRPVDLRSLLLGPASGEAEGTPPAAHWLLSLFAPAAGESIDWEKGSYSLLTRSGRVESPAAWGAPKKSLRMVTEGSVLVASQPPVGRAHDVSPDGFPHPVFRSGFAVSVPVPWRAA